MKNNGCEFLLLVIICHINIFDGYIFTYEVYFEVFTIIFFCVIMYLFF